MQPVVGRLVLPRFGGAAAAWLACLLFFQLGLVAGYAYAHLLVQTVSPRAQGWVHLVLLGSTLAFLPLAIDAQGPVGVPGSPWRVLLLLGGAVGVPYGLLAATGPLLQRWYVRELPERSPYRLYALSNAASLGALALYPFVIEPIFGLRQQVAVWSWLFAGFAFITGWCAVRAIRGPSFGAGYAGGGRVADPAASADEPRPTLGQIGLWVALAAAGAAMLMATTNQLTQEVAGFPFVWLVPLSLYLLTFVVCFDHERWYDRRVFLPLLAVAIPVAVATLTGGTRAMFWTQLLAYGSALTACCMACHGELVRSKPAVRHLTSFYLAIAVGGALGGAFVAVIAPLVFRGFWELHVSLTACAVLALVAVLDDPRVTPRPGFLLAAFGGVVVALVALLVAVVVLRFSWESGFAFEPWNTIKEGVVGLSFTHRKYLVMAATATFIAGIGLVGDWLNARVGMASRWYTYSVPGAALMVPVALVVQLVDFNRSAIHTERDFYGVLRVVEWGGGPQQEGAYRELVHGHINHGTQYLAPDHELAPTSYYGEASGAGVALGHRRRVARSGGTALRIGVVGLGIGTVATYGTPGDTIRFYELDPNVARLATEYFTYLAKSAARVEIVVGDARRSMEAELAAGAGRRFDVLAVDAFLGDAIPVHLLTEEALAAYLGELREDGLLALHLSNRLLDLRPLALGLAAQYGLRAVLVRSGGDREAGTSDATWAVLARPGNPFFEDPAVAGAVTAWPGAVMERATSWTDDYSSLFRLLAQRDR